MDISNEDLGEEEVSLTPMADLLAGALLAAEIPTSRADHSGKIPPPPPPPLPTINPVLTGSVEKKPVTATRLSKSIRVQRDNKFMPKSLGATGAEKTCGDFHSLDDGRLVRSHLIEDSTRMQLGSTSFIPANWQCLACEEHVILPKKRNLPQWKEGGRLVILSDQNISPLIPSDNKSCPAVIRVEGGSLRELGDSFCCILGDHTLPEGSVIAIGSLSHLQKEGMSSYSTKMVTECRRFRAMFKNQVVVIPFTPMPLCGTSDSNLVKLIMDYSLYMDSLGNNCHAQYNSAVRDHIHGQVFENPILLDHVSSGLALPLTHLEYETGLYDFGGWSNLPSTLPAIQEDLEAKLYSTLLSGIAGRYKIKLDTSPIIDRSSLSTDAADQDTVAIILGGSNAGNLASSFSSRGSNVLPITKSGWQLTAASCREVIPNLSSSCISVENSVPVVLFLLDNSSFKCSDEDGELSPIKRYEDGTRHVEGELVVMPESSMLAVINSLIKLIQACGTRRVYVLTPVPRYVTAPCCDSPTHCTHLSDPGAGIRICCGIHRLNTLLRKQLKEFPNCSVLCTGDILAGKDGAAPSEVLEATSSWGPVHGPTAAYDLIAEHLSEQLKTVTRSKRPREETMQSGDAGRQRSRGHSFNDGVNNRPRTAPGSSTRFAEQMISYPIQQLGRSRGGGRSGAYGS